MPGLSVSLGGGTNQTYLRGVGSFATDASAESAIAYNINGVYISRPSGVGPIFFDLERVEVLKGPQGTLYGRNATGGAINLIARRPARELSGEATVDVGNFDARKVTGAIGGGVTDTLSLRAAAQYSKRDGYLTDGYDDQDSVAARLSALWEPNESTSLLVTGEYVDVDSQGEVTVKRSTLTPVPSDPWAGPSVGNVQQPPTAFIPGGTRINNDGFNDIKVGAVSAQLDVELSGATLTFIPAYRDTDVAYLTYTPGFYFRTDEGSKQQSYELRLGNNGDVLKWVTGLYYFDEDQTQIYNLQARPIQESTVNTPLQTRSYAAFGEVTYSLTDGFRLIGGLRYSNDEKQQEGFTQAVLPAPATTNNSGQARVRRSQLACGRRVRPDRAEHAVRHRRHGFQGRRILPVGAGAEQQLRAGRAHGFHRRLAESLSRSLAAAQLRRLLLEVSRQAGALPWRHACGHDGPAHDQRRPRHALWREHRSAVQADEPRHVPTGSRSR